MGVAEETVRKPFCVFRAMETTGLRNATEGVPYRSCSSRPVRRVVPDTLLPCNERPAWISPNEPENH